jgi:UDP-glucose 4-epimerase
MSIHILGYGPISVNLKRVLSAEFEVFVYSELPQRDELQVLSYSDLIPVGFKGGDIVVLGWRGLPPNNTPKQKILQMLSEKMTMDNRLINLSSVAVYGNTASPASEDHPISLVNSYGVGKKALEEYCDLNLDTTVHHLRISNVFGDIAFDDIVNRMLRSQKDCKPLSIAEPTKITRDFISIETLLRAIKEIVVDVRSFQKREVLNICSGESITLHTLMEIVRSINGDSLNFTETTAPNDVICSSLISNKRIKSRYSMLQFSEFSNLKNYVSNFKKV